MCPMKLTIHHGKEANAQTLLPVVSFASASAAHMLEEASPDILSLQAHKANDSDFQKEAITEVATGLSAQ